MCSSDLDGRAVAAVPVGEQMAGVHAARWDGRDDAGHRVAPGVYLVAVAVLSEEASGLRLRPVGVAY